MILTIALNTTSTVSVKNDDIELYHTNCFFPDITNELNKVIETYGSNSFEVIVLSGQQHYTSKLLSEVKALFGDTANIIVYGK